jgi:hypothetical protein
VKRRSLRMKKSNLMPMMKWSSLRSMKAREEMTRSNNFMIGEINMSNA